MSAKPTFALLVGTLLLGIGTFSSAATAQNRAAAAPDFGPNVYIFDPSMPASQVQSTLTSLSNEAQFSTNRYAILFMPGAYNLEAPVGYYESIAGLGQSPNDVTITGFLTPNFGTTFPGANVTTTFWRSMENMTFNPTTDAAQDAAPIPFNGVFRKRFPCAVCRSMALWN